MIDRLEMHSCDRLIDRIVAESTEDNLDRTCRRPAGMNTFRFGCENSWGVN